MRRITSVSTWLLLGAVASALLDSNAAPKKLVHKLRYATADWRPHFGYHPGHLASEHRYRYKQANLTHGPTQKPQGVANRTVLPLDQYIVRLLVDGKVTCNGIIINTLQVLTVAVCLVGLPVEKLHIKLFDGSLYTAFDTKEAHGFGIGREVLVLLLLHEQLDQRYSQPPPICTGKVNPTETVQLWYWNSRRIALKNMRAKQVDRGSCRRTINDPEGKVTSYGTICLRNIKYTSKCQPSFGLPFVWNEQFCGINILGHNCPRRMNVDIYVELLDEKRYVAHVVNEVYKSGLEEEIL